MVIPSPGIYRDVQIGQETFAILAVSSHDACTAMTAVHTTDFPQTIGGARFVVNGSLEELGHLSSGMTDKCMAAGIPAGGQKSVLIVPGPTPSLSKRADLLAGHIAFVTEHYKGAVFGPDMNNPEAVLDLLVTQHPELLPHVTGLSEQCNGLSIDRNGFTAQGLVESIRVWQSETMEPLRTVSVQGFGAVGAHAARLLHEHGYRVRGVSIQTGCILAKNYTGLDIPSLFYASRSGGDDAVERYASTQPHAIRWVPRASALYDQPSDIFIPAARTSCFGTPKELAELAGENPDVADVSELRLNTGLRLVVEGANHPLSYLAEEYLEQNGIAILTDYIVNCGGLIGCWIEWQCRSNGESASELAHFEAQKHIRRVVADNVHAILRSHKWSRPAAAGIVTNNRAAMKLQGGGHVK